MGRALASVGLVLVLTGCGGTRMSRHATTPCQETAPVERSLARLAADVRRIRAAAALPTRDTLKGNPTISRATDRFVADLAASPLDLVSQNRQIDHAAAALVGACEQCFQALEAGRPIVTLKNSGPGKGCRATS